MKKRFKYVIYVDVTWKIRWRMRSAYNGRIVANGEGYNRKGDIKKLLKHFPEGRVVDMTSGSEIYYSSVSEWIKAK